MYTCGNVWAIFIFLKLKPVLVRTNQPRKVKSFCAVSYRVGEHFHFLYHHEHTCGRRDLEVHPHTFSVWAL